MIIVADSKRALGGLKGDDSLGVFVGIANHNVHPTGGELIVMLLRGDTLRHTCGKDSDVHWAEAAGIDHDDCRMVRLPRIVCTNSEVHITIISSLITIFGPSQIKMPPK